MTYVLELLQAHSEKVYAEVTEQGVDFTEEYFLFLDSLRASGQTNMLGARPYLTAAYPELDKLEAGKVLVAWMQTFFERHPELG